MQNLDDFSAVSCEILQIGPQNLAKKFWENWALIINTDLSAALLI